MEPFAVSIYEALNHFDITILRIGAASTADLLRIFTYAFTLTGQHTLSACPYTQGRILSFFWFSTIMLLCFF